MTDLIYLAISGAGLVALAAVLVVIGKVAADCPEIGGAARLGTWVVTTGFVAIGFGVFSLIGAGLPVLLQGRLEGLYFAIGCVAIVLGTGFYVAAWRLRDILAAARANLDAIRARTGT